MPELPEVRTVATFLDKKVRGLSIVKVNNFTPKLIWKNDEVWFYQTVLNRKIKSVSNYGKYLIFDLLNFKMISHLRMEGKWSVSQESQHIYPKQHLRIEFELSNGLFMRYYDSRKFGTLELWENGEYLNKSGIAKLGPEPLNNKPPLEYLKPLALKKSIKVKTFLLDQSILCGIGNIYADEILFAANIAPDRTTNTLSDDELLNIIRFSNNILNKAIHEKGSSIRSYKSADGQEGSFQNYLKVHMRENKPCFVCHTPIVKSQIGGRGTYFCVHCQK